MAVLLAVLRAGVLVAVLVDEKVVLKVVKMGALTECELVS